MRKVSPDRVYTRTRDLPPAKHIMHVGCWCRPQVFNFPKVDPAQGLLIVHHTHGNISKSECGTAKRAMIGP